MSERVDRRSFLATATAVTGVLAGCAADPVSTDDGSPTDRSRATAPDDSGGSSPTGESTGTTAPGGETESATETATGTGEGVGREGRIVPPAIEDGELLDDFRDERWFGLRNETVSLDRTEAISGKYALRIENPDRYSTVGFAPTSSLSLEGRNISMAVKVESPVGGRIELRLRAPDGKNRYVCTRQLPPAMGDWMRIDFGITRGWNDPDISEIMELRLEVAGPEGSNVRYWIDDVRITEAAGTPHAILAFYGGLDSHYETVFPMLEERGWAAAVPVRPAGIGDEGRMGIGRLREVREAGWDVCSFPNRGAPLPEMSAEKQRDVITTDKQRLEKRGFVDGACHFFAPYHSIDGDTAEILREVHDTGYLYGGSSVGVPPTAPFTIPTINGNDYASSRAVVLRANLHDQLVVLGFDEIGGDGMSVEDFRAQLDRIENNDYAGGLDVTTPSELVEQYL